ncbi:MAG TPA: hypothetical protein VFC14_06300 [Burkholderiales bacterium]|nr:hypothetical protein [Burkholderiales bacterium]
MKDERGRMTRPYPAFCLPDDADEDRNQLIGFGNEGVRRAFAHELGFPQKLQPVSRLVEFLKRAFDLADEIRVGFRAAASR